MSESNETEQTTTVQAPAPRPQWARYLWTKAVVTLVLVFALVSPTHSASTVPTSTLPTQTTTKDDLGALPACALEDGSGYGQAFPCLWDAARQGNGQGQSYILTGRLCTEQEIRVADAAHKAGLRNPIEGLCDDAESSTILLPEGAPQGATQGASACTAPEGALFNPCATLDTTQVQDRRA